MRPGWSGRRRRRLRWPGRLMPPVDARMRTPVEAVSMWVKPVPQSARPRLSKWHFRLIGSARTLGDGWAHERGDHRRNTPAQSTRAFVDGPRPPDSGGAGASSPLAPHRASRSGAVDAVWAPPRRRHAALHADHSDPVAPDAGRAWPHLHEVGSGALDASRLAHARVSIRTILSARPGAAGAHRDRPRDDRGRAGRAGSRAIRHL